MKTILKTLLILCFFPSQIYAQKFVGGDISLLTAYEQASVKYMDQNGQDVGDILTYLKSDAVGWNAQRVRLFVDPQQASTGDKRSGVCQDLSYVAALGKRIKQAGFKFMLDFHYSDSWADPSKQTKPASWSSASTTNLTDTMYTYTRRCLEYLTAHGATPDFIQTGNEISFGMLWPEAKIDAYNDTNWSTFIAYLKNAIRACREICPQAGIIIHTEQAKNITTTINYYDRIQAAGIDYDIIGLSYYPFWHGDLSNLDNLLTQLSTRYSSKKVQIVETAYFYQYQPTTGLTDYSSIWPISPEGQAVFTRDLINVLKQHDNVNGLYWWFPEENGANNSVIGGWINRGLWNNNTGRANPALYEMKGYLSTANSISPCLTEISSGEPERYFSLDGICHSQIPHEGIYIYEGKKIAAKR